MTQPTNSRFITYNSTVDKSTNYTIVVIDATELEVEDIAMFCKVSNKNYDVYLYRGELDDLQWLSEVSNRADWTLVASTSQVKIDNSKQLTIFGNGLECVSPLAYLQNIDDPSDQL